MRQGLGVDGSRTMQRWLVFFFFSSRRRHTRFDCDWSSDVCSSDLTSVETSIEAREIGMKVEGVHKALRSARSEEHTSELQSQSNLVCRLLLEKKKKNKPKEIIQFHDVVQDTLRNIIIAYYSSGMLG